MSPASASEHTSGLELAPARPLELGARLMILFSFAALVYALWDPNLTAAAAWTGKELRVLPRMSVFLLAAVCALVIQGGRPGARLLAVAGSGALVLGLALLPWAEVPGGAEIQRTAPLAGSVVELLRFECALAAAVLLGTWLGRSLQTPLHFLALLMCAVAGDVWLSTFRVPESMPSANALTLLRVPWPPPAGHLGLTPPFLDLVVLSALIQASRTLRYHVLSVVLGAVAGYCGASFLALEPWPAWPALSMLMCACGVLISCWPDLKCSAYDVGKALLIGATLLALLLGMTALQRKLHPLPENNEDFSRYRNVAQKLQGGPDRSALQCVAVTEEYRPWCRRPGGRDL